MHLTIGLTLLLAIHIVSPSFLFLAVIRNTMRNIFFASIFIYILDYIILGVLEV
jgi:hypothetical protein